MRRWSGRPCPGRVVPLADEVGNRREPRCRTLGGRRCVGVHGRIARDLRGRRGLGGRRGVCGRRLFSDLRDGRRCGCSGGDHRVGRRRGVGGSRCRDWCRSERSRLSCRRPGEAADDDDALRTSSRFVVSATLVSELAPSSSEPPVANTTTPTTTATSTTGIRICSPMDIVRYRCHTPPEPAGPAPRCWVRRSAEVGCRPSRRRRYAPRPSGSSSSSWGDPITAIVARSLAAGFILVGGRQPPAVAR